MIDTAFQAIAEKIHYVLLPGIKQAISNALFDSVIQQMSADEIQIACIKFILEAIVLILIIWLGKIISSSSKANKEQKKSKEISKRMPEKLWTPDGWYWDDKKGKWIGPDFPQNNKNSSK